MGVDLALDWGGGTKNSYAEILRAEFPNDLCLEQMSIFPPKVLMTFLLISSFGTYFAWMHSFIPAISIAPLQVLYYSEALPTTAWIYTVSEFSRRSAQATVGKGLAQGSYVVARAGVKPTTLRLKVIVSTNAPPRPEIIRPWELNSCLNTFYWKSTSVIRPKLRQKFAAHYELNALGYTLSAVRLTTLNKFNASWKLFLCSRVRR